MIERIPFYPARGLNLFTIVPYHMQNCELIPCTIKADSIDSLGVNLVNIAYVWGQMQL